MLDLKYIMAAKVNVNSLIHNTPCVLQTQNPKIPLLIIR